MGIFSDEDFDGSSQDMEAHQRASDGLQSGDDADIKGDADEIKQRNKHQAKAAVSTDMEKVIWSAATKTEARMRMLLLGRDMSSDPPGFDQFSDYYWMLLGSYNITPGNDTQLDQDATQVCNEHLMMRYNDFVQERNIRYQAPAASTFNQGGGSDEGDL
jgi:hypothetical protein